jgi:hypothetical protein
MKRVIFLTMGTIKFATLLWRIQGKCQGVFWLFFVKSFDFTYIELCIRERLFSFSP